MRARWKNQANKIGSASKFHNKVRDILCTPPWNTMKCYQEVPVCDLVPGYPDTSHHVDWFVEPLHTIIELHGNQHYKMVNYGGVGYDQAMDEFHNIQKRDLQKKTALLEAGYRYLEIPYKLRDKLTPAELMNLIITQGEEYEEDPS